MRKDFLSLILVIFFSMISATADELKKITILQTADIHSRTGSVSEPGIGQLASALDLERKKAGGTAKCLLIDCGDILQGSFAGSFSRGNVGLGFLNELKYDIWIPGNHDFDFGTERFLEIMKGCSASIIAANLDLNGKRLAPAWKIIEKDGVRIAVIGMTSPGLDRWHWGKNASGISSSSFGGPLDEIIPKVTDARCDMIILAVHQGIFQSDKSDFNLNRIAEKYPQIDLVLGAHTHQGAPGERIGTTSWYAQSEAYCTSYSKIIAEVDLAKHRTVKMESRLVPVAADGTVSFKFSSELENLLSKANENSGKTIVSLDKEIAADELNRMTAEAYFASVPGAASVLLIPQDRIIKAGKFTEDDLCWSFPFEDTLCTIELASEDLKSAQDEVAKLKDGTSLTLINNGKLADDSGRRTVALSSYMLAGAGGRIRSLANFAKDPSCKATDTGVLLRDTFRFYVKKTFSTR